jgi:hypothetical protein
MFAIFKFASVQTLHFSVGAWALRSISRPSAVLHTLRTQYVINFASTKTNLSNAFYTRFLCWKRRFRDEKTDIEDPRMFPSKSFNQKRFRNLRQCTQVRTTCTRNRTRCTRSLPPSRHHFSSCFKIDTDGRGLRLKVR